LEESRQSLRELEELYGRRVREAWGGRLTRQVPAYVYTGMGVEPTSAPLVGMNAPGSDYGPAGQPEEDGRRLVTSLRLRGQTIGSVVLRREVEEEPWTPDEVALAEEVSTQIALALENARLLEESRQRAEREQLISQVTARFSRSLDIDAVLRSAVHELGQLPHVAEVSIHIEPPEEAAD